MKLSNAKGGALGPYLGYALQQVRLFYHLLSAESETMSAGVEHVEDVSVHSPSECVLAEQCKSALTSNPVSNWAEGLWKTFDLWVVNSTDGIYDPEKTRFQLYVTPVKSGEFVKRLSDAKDEGEIRNLICEIAKKRKTLSSSSKSAVHLDNILKADIDVVIKIVKNFKFISEHDDPLTPIYAHLDSTVSKKIKEKACSFGIGDAVRRIEKSVKDGADPIVSVSEFRNTFRAFINKYDASNVLHSIADTPNDALINETLADVPTFVRQLNLIEADIEDKTRAASDFLRSSAARTSWAEEGDIFEGSIDEYNNDLKSRFTNVRREVEITQSSLDSKVRGELVFHRCCQIPPVPLQGRVVPLYFLPGSLHDLSNRVEIGWHPHFVGLLHLEPEE